MVNESAGLQSTDLELATFGEVLYAFSSLRSTSGRRRGERADADMLPWEEATRNAADECRPPQAPRKVATQHAPMHPAAQPRVAKPRRMSGRCQCGQCRNCLENARWERIFQEKFANSDYYHHDIRVRYASPLSSV